MVMRHPLGVIGVYLCLVAPPLLLGPWTAAHAAFAIGHLGVAVVLIRSSVSGSDARPWAAWLALAAMPLLYTEIRFLNQAFTSGYRDPTIIALEAAIFGSPATELAGAVPFLPLSEVLHLLYVAFYPAIYLPPLLLHRSGRFRELTLNASALLATATLCYVVFVYYPVQGPRYVGPPQGVPDGPMRGLSLRILESGSSRGAAFPSSHMAITVCQAVLHWRWSRPLGLTLGVVALGVGVGAVYGGFHYAVDMVVGGMIGAAVAAAYLRWDSAAKPAETPA